MPSQPFLFFLNFSSTALQGCASGSYSWGGHTWALGVSAPLCPPLCMSVAPVTHQGMEDL